MKLAVLADIHANLAALETVAAHVEAWQPDAVVVAGDVVNRGPQPAACLDMVLERQRDSGWLTVLPQVVVQDELRNGILVVVGQSTELQERFYAITTPRRHRIAILEALLERSSEAAELR